MANNTTLPSLVDYLENINGSDVIQVGRMFMDPWISFMGSFFWGGIVMAIGISIYLKTERAEPMAVWFIIMTILGGVLLPGEAEGFPMVYLLGLIAGFTVGFTLYQLFISTIG